MISGKSVLIPFLLHHYILSYFWHLDKLPSFCATERPKRRKDSLRKYKDIVKDRNIDTDSIYIYIYIIVFNYHDCDCHFIGQVTSFVSPSPPLYSPPLLNL